MDDRKPDDRKPDDRKPDDHLPAEAVALLESLLAADTPAFRALRAQIPHLRVTGGCKCPCPSLDLALADPTAAPAAPVTDTPAAEATVVDADGTPIGGVMVFVTEGRLSYLEVYSWADEPITRLPSPDRLLP
ncbi:hypothetical protein ACIQWA_34710 [Kitasatospora sp. NPDC098652]|uniref:hypothetical protein n=1 Tax=Kitasatospora sp. NPDC098652 TaxID=3364095 RepID=UPI0038206B90